MTETKQSVLVVDDTPENIDILVGILRDSYAVRVAGSGERALRLAAEHPPDLILLDIMMPGLVVLILIFGISTLVTLFRFNTYDPQ